ncbi:hypothetical protein DY218_27255 [Streptomyces triticagri]|uniref:Head-to-tail adaptor n=1 Tax=Streptomyces triticagri TaxID=2293568 RepID=A0A372LY52_9ACTN|nr:hypothetical protein [Streptomyces triticagri]RFU83608.1 hypothetical protein DY218_27255 [Streptomyces triticagri]
MSIQDGPCAPWPIDPSCCPTWPDDEADWEPAHHAAAEVATETLWRLSAGRYGLCEEYIRPCRAACYTPKSGAGGGVLDPYIDNGRWFNRTCGCTTGCHCGTLCSVALPGPVHDVVEVKLDGRTVRNWMLLDQGGRTELVRTAPELSPPLLDVLPDTSDPTGMSVLAIIDNTAGAPPGDDPGCWPNCQNLTAPDTEPDTFSVRYLRGIRPPAGAVRAVSSLACEIVKQCRGARDCRLPERVKSITREGITMDVFDPGEWLDKGRTGLPEVDSWLSEVNPNGLRQRAAVFSLDLPAAPPSLGRNTPGGLW